MWLGLEMWLGIEMAVIWLGLKMARASDVARDRDG